MHSNNRDSDRITEFTSTAARISDKLHEMGVPQADVDRAMDTLTKCVLDADHTDYCKQETHFVGDSMTSEAIDNTAEAIRELRTYMENTFAQITMRIDHIARHDRAFPTEGCEYCGVPSAA